MFTICCCNPETTDAMTGTEKLHYPWKKRCFGTSIHSSKFYTIPVKCYNTEMPSSVRVLYHCFPDMNTVLYGVYVFKLLQQVKGLTCDATGQGH